MTTASPPNDRTGKICYVEIPATDIERSADFYARAFGWQTRRRGDGALAFDDAVGQVSGTWVLSRPPSSEPGLLIYIMVASAARAVDAVIAAGGEILPAVHPDEHAIIARFRDPAGNVLGIYEQPGLAATEAQHLATAEQR